MRSPVQLTTFAFLILAFGCFIRLHSTSDHEVIVEEIPAEYDSEAPLPPQNIVEIDEVNLTNTSRHNQVVLVNFYVDWCPFSQKLMPIWEQAADKAAELYADRPGRLVFARLNGDKQANLSKRFHVNKFPTIKAIIFGKMMSHEYRGPRKVKAILSHAEELLKDQIEYVSSTRIGIWLENRKKPTIVRYSDAAPGNKSQFFIFRKTASDLRYDCTFVWASKNTGLESSFERDSVEFHPLVANPLEVEHLIFPGKLDDYRDFMSWATAKCNPLISEVTFNNAEEITEEGVPLLILFMHPDDKESLRIYSDAVGRELANETDEMSFHYANGLVFDYPLKKISKTKKDLPLVLLDDFSHLYQFPGGFSEIATPGKLAKFVADLHSGRLHVDYHQVWIDAIGKIVQPDAIANHLEGIASDSGDEKSETEVEDPKANEIEDELAPKKDFDNFVSDTHPDDIQKYDEVLHNVSNAKPGPVESIFIKLTPSKYQYTFKNYHDEL